MRAIVVIPARLESTRLPAKLLRQCAGKTVIEWTWRAACKAELPVLIATDSSEIERAAHEFGARVIRTGSANNGTERCAAALEIMPERPEFIINWQGDNPLADPDLARGILDSLEFYKDAQVTTPVRYSYHLEATEACAVMRAHDHRALFFTRQPVPTGGPFWVHLGLYCYRSAALRKYRRVATPLEEAESLEQNRWLEIDVPVRCCPFARMDYIREVNDAADLEAVEQTLLKWERGEHEPLRS